MNDLDVIIFGGGIAGLWTLNRLVQQGYQVALLEPHALGGEQSIRSQGIIHGGLKYALGGKLDSAVTALSDMPSIWQSCIQKEGEIDLSKVKIMADGQYLWSTNLLTGGLTTLFASNALSSHVAKVAKDQWPQVIKDSSIHSQVYKLSELILDIPSLVDVLATPLLSNCIKMDSEDCKLDIDDSKNIQSVSFSSHGHVVKLKAKTYIFTAGSGNAALMQSLAPRPVMQRRPLQMVLVQDKNLPTLYGHCVGLSSAPRLTITTHFTSDGLPVWYLGGKLAEDGINLSPEKQIEQTKSELADIFPKLDLRNAKIATFFIDRAEEQQASGKKPDGPTIFAAHNYCIAWPTKLAFAPALTQLILQQMQQNNIQPTPGGLDAEISNLHKPPLAIPIWDQLL